MERLRTRFPHTLVLSFEPSGRDQASFPTRTALVGRSDHDITLDFVAEVRGTLATDAESALLLDACDCCRQAGEADQVLGTA